MKIKKITAADTQSALREVKSVLGADAIILNVEEKIDRKAGVTYVEVTAAIDEEFSRTGKSWQASVKPTEPNLRNVGSQLNFYLDEPAEGFTYSRPAAPSTRLRETQRKTESMPAFSELQEVREQLGSMMMLLQNNGFPQLPSTFMDIYARLINSGVEKSLATNLLQGVEKRLSFEAKKSRDYVRTEIIKSLEQYIACIYNEQKPKQQGQQIKAMIGPTGVGKTTCIAKLSAIDKIFHNRKVGLISLDTYRIAAIEQLRTYANIAKMLLEVAYTVEDVENALINLSDCDVIYIDTPGRSPKNFQALKEMSQFLKCCPELEVHLVLSLTSKTEDLNETVEKFSLFPIRQLLFTKLDETNSIGSILSVMHHAKHPVSYIANGQNVPDDIQQADSKTIAKMIMGVQTS